jgi:tetratricopeptide (TPR) repeat protein
MKIIHVFSAIAALSLIATSVQAMDGIKTIKGTTISGKILRISCDQVDIEQGVGDNKSEKAVPVNQIAIIFFDAGSQTVKKALNSAKTAIAVDRQYVEGLKFLAKINPSDIDDDYLKQDYDFYTAFANAKLAQSGEGKIQDAGKAMLDFAKKNPKSYHFYDACEVLGDMLVAVNSNPQAEEYYGKLTKAPWPEVKMKAGVLMGRAQLAQHKFDEAEKSFQAVIDNPVEGPQADSQRTIALIGKASVLTTQKKAEEAVKILSDIIDKGDNEDAELMSRAYNARGTAYRQLGNLDEAKFDFLHTDKLYSTMPDAHAEALANLAEIWEQLHNTDRAIEAKKTLDKLYINSPWAKGESKQ